MDPKCWMPTVAANMRRYRLMTSLTQHDCARAFGARESYWRGLEAGTKHLSISRLIEVAAFLGVSASDLLEGV